MVILILLTNYVIALFLFFSMLKLFFQEKDFDTWYEMTAF